jgi:hypothetical protein
MDETSRWDDQLIPSIQLIYKLVCEFVPADVYYTAQYWGFDAFADGNQVNMLQHNLGIIPREVAVTRTRPSLAFCSRWLIVV